jgi:hypothetical protein
MNIDTFETETASALIISAITHLQRAGAPASIADRLLDALRDLSDLNEEVEGESWAAR